MDNTIALPVILSKSGVLICHHAGQDSIGRLGWSIGGDSVAAGAGVTFEPASGSSNHRLHESQTKSLLLEDDCQLLQDGPINVSQK